MKYLLSLLVWLWVSVAMAAGIPLYNTAVGLGIANSSFGAIAPSATVGQSYNSTGATSNPAFGWARLSQGSTPITGTPNVVLTNSSGVLGSVSPSTTVNGQSCSLGASCTISTALITNASGSSLNTSATCVASNAAVTLASAIDFVNGQGIALEHCGAAFSGSTPTGLTVAASGKNGQGPTGSTNYAYEVACVDANGGVGVASSPVSISNGNATLGTITQSAREYSFNYVTWTTSCPGTAVYRSTSGGAYILLGIYGQAQYGATVNSIDDSGIPISTIPYVPALPPSATLNDRFVTTVVSGGGTTSLILAAAPTTSASAAYTRHDDTAALTSYFSTVFAAQIPPGVFNVEGLTVPSTVYSVSGASQAATTLNGWATQSPVVTAGSMPSGFFIGNMTIATEAPGNDVGAYVYSSRDCKVSYISASGNPAILLQSDTNCDVSNFILTNWTGQGVFDYLGSGNTVHNGTQYQAIEPNQSVGIHGYQSPEGMAYLNKSFGGSVYSVEYEASNQSSILSNYATGTLREAYHFGGSVSGGEISYNTEFGAGVSIDYCISISDDDVNGSVLNSDTIASNYLYGCGISSIAISQFGGTSVTISGTSISDNHIYGSNADAQATTPDIVIMGSGVVDTFVNDNTFVSGSSVDYLVEELASPYGQATQTQVGAMYGLAGASGKAHLMGSGSVVLSGGSTGL